MSQAPYLARLCLSLMRVALTLEAKPKPPFFCRCKNPLYCRARCCGGCYYGAHGAARWLYHPADLLAEAGKARQPKTWSTTSPAVNNSRLCGDSRRGNREPPRSQTRYQCIGIRFQRTYGNHTIPHRGALEGKNYFYY